MALALFAGDANATTRSCGVDPVANTADVLCLAPSGPCDVLAVNLTTAVEVTDGGCVFDLGGRDLVVGDRLEMVGSGFIDVINAGAILLTSTGKLKARGDFAPPPGTVDSGGAIELESASTITLHSGAVIDVSGESAGAISLTAATDLTLQTGALLRANGISAAFNEGDGGGVLLAALNGDVHVAGDVELRSQSQGVGGDLVVTAAGDVSIDRLIDASGGATDGGIVDVLAGDDVVITKSIDVESRGGGGDGGLIFIAAGEDSLGGSVPGGGVTVSGATLRLNASSEDDIGGIGGDLDISAAGPILVDGNAAIRANAGTAFDGDGGLIRLDTEAGDPTVVTALDGSIDIDGSIIAKSGNDGGFGGIVEVAAGTTFTIGDDVDLTGRDGGGTLITVSGDGTTIDGAVTLQATSTDGNGGVLDMQAGTAVAADLVVLKNLLAHGGNNASGQSIRLAGCGLVVDEKIKIDGSGGLAGAVIELLATEPMDLRKRSKYFADPAGSITLTYPPGQDPVIGSQVTFDPAAAHNPTAGAAYPGCGT